MKNFFTVLALVVLLGVMLIFRNVAAQPAPTPTIQPSSYVAPVATSTPAASNIPLISWGKNMWHKMMGGDEHVSTGIEVPTGPMGMMGGGGGNKGHGTMMVYATQTGNDVTQALGVSTQDLYNHMMNGNSLVQIAAEKGVTEQQLMDTIMGSQRAMYDQSVKAGYMTQEYADTMLQNFNSNLKMMVNEQGNGANPWGMMWNNQADLVSGYSGMHE